MEKEFWNKKWQSNDIGFNQSQPNSLMQRYFPELDLKPGARVFVPLCGKSIDMLWLVGQGYQIVGVELNQLACDAFFEENNIPVTISETGDFIIYTSQSITLFSGDFFKINQAIIGKIDAVYDRAALIALPTEMRRLYARHVSQLLEFGTGMLLLTMPYNQSEMQGPPFSVTTDEVNSLFTAHFDIRELYSKALAEIPAFLRARGLLHASEQVWLLTLKDGI